MHTVFMVPVYLPTYQLFVEHDIRIIYFIFAKYHERVIVNIKGNQSPKRHGEQYRFDAFCKAVLRNEARNYRRNKKRLLDREKSFSVLSLEELGQLTSVDHYPSEEFVFSSYGCDLHIDNELVANAFATLPKQEQSILILFCVLELGDGEIGDLMGMSRSAVQRHRTKTLNELQKKLKAHLPEGG